MYEIMAGISVFIREFCLANPFEILGEGLIVNMGGSAILLHPTTLNWIANLFIPGLTYCIVGIYYEERSNPVLGSFLYLIFFVVHNSLLELMCRFGFTKWAIVIIGGLYIVCHIAVNRIREHFIWPRGC